MDGRQDGAMPHFTDTHTHLKSFGKSDAASHTQL